MFNKQLNAKCPFILFLILLSILVTKGCGYKSLNTPQFPPQEWRVWLDIDLSNDIVFQLLKKKPSKNVSPPPFGRISFLLSEDGSLEATSNHPVITGKITDNYLDFLGKETIAFIPIEDQRLIYKHCFEAIEVFDFTDKFEYSGYDASGVDISLMFEVNGRSITLEYNKIQQSELLPAPISKVLSIIYRNLPSKYDMLFDFLKVPKPSRLSSEKRDKYAKCEIHNEWMSVDTVEIIYGLPLPPDEGFYEAKTNLFPNANSEYFGGCIVGDNKKRNVLYCISCRKTEKKWLKKSVPLV